MKVLVTGVAGQLGHDVINELHRRGFYAIGSDRRQEAEILHASNWKKYVRLDVTDKTAVNRAIEETKPDAIIHCAAWTNVDGAEDSNNKPLARMKNNSYLCSVKGEAK